MAESKWFSLRNLFPKRAGRTFDASVYGISAVILLPVSISAMLAPAFRATQVDPMQALRGE
ncbi:MAG: hypothetical protein WBH45_10195 [Acidobacteriaceae bacterium]